MLSITPLTQWETGSEKLICPIFQSWWVTEDLNPGWFDSTHPLHCIDKTPKREKQHVQTHKDNKEELAGTTTIKQWLRNCVFSVTWSLYYCNRLYRLSTCFSLFGRWWGLPCQNFPAEVLWIRYSVLWCESSHPWNSWAGLRQQKPSGNSRLQASWVYYRSE